MKSLNCGKSLLRKAQVGFESDFGFEKREKIIVSTPQYFLKTKRVASKILEATRFVFKPNTVAPRNSLILSNLFSLIISDL